MANKTLPERLKQEFLDILDETFVRHHGIYLDKNTSLFETLETISAETASRPVSAHCASLAAQVDHVRFYLDVLEAGMVKKDIGEVNWNAIWNTVEAVNEEEWEAIKERLNASYQRVLAVINSFDTWEGEDDIAGSLAIVVHTAYHLGEIRQALCTLT